MQTETSRACPANSGSSSSLEKIIQKLNSGGWVFSDFIPSFRATLENALRSREIKCLEALPLFLLSSQYYKKIVLSAELASHFANLRAQTTRARILSISTEEERKFWQMAFATVEPNTTPSEATAGDVDELQQAMALLDHYSREKIGFCLSNMIDIVACFHKGSFRSASHPHYFGCIFMQIDKPAAEMALSFVHELAHQELFLLNLADRLITSQADYNLVHAPFQGRARPPIGRLHSAHALFRMVDYEKFSNDGSFEKHLNTLQETIASFGNDELTPFGKELVHVIYQTKINQLRSLS